MTKIIAPTLRTPETLHKYQEFIDHGGNAEGCRLCEKLPLRRFTYWKIVTNDFPYDKVAEKHDMLMPIRHTTEAELTAEERAELVELKNGVINDDYQFIMEATHKTKTIPGHFHYHIWTVRE